VEQVYRFRTPDRPVLRFDVAGLAYEESRWISSELDGMLDSNLQRILYQLESLPETDYVPALHPAWSGSGLIPEMYGVEFDRPPQGGLLPKRYLISDLEEALRVPPQPEAAQTEQGQAVLSQMRFLVEATEGQLQIVYPQMQGPLSNTVRLMPQEELLMACVERPELVRELVERTWRVALDLSKAILEAVGKPELLRPRLRGHQPEWVRAVIVDDYVSVNHPDNFFALCENAWRMTSEELGPVFFHTCGPVLQCAQMMKQLPGLAGFETVFVKGNSKTTRDLEEMKQAIAGELVMQSCDLPHGETVHDGSNLTAEWLRSISKDGGFIMCASGDAEAGRNLLSRLELA